MKTSLPRIVLLTAGIGLSITLPLAAQGPGRGPGGGPGGGGFQEAIHTLFKNHSKIKRTVEITATGYKSRTVSDDPEIARTLQKHVKEMRGRLGAGMMIRRWDPAFAELVEHYQDLEHDFKEVAGGVEMTATGKTPEGVKVAQNHAGIVSGFVEKGPVQMHEPHPRALGSEKPAVPAAGAAKAACPACREATTAGCPKGREAAAKTGGPPCKAAEEPGDSEPPALRRPAPPAN